MAYSSQHATALRTVQRKGAAISFAGPTRTVAGVAVEDHNSRVFRTDSMVRTDAPVLFFVPTTLGDEPELNATGDWAGVTYVASKVRRIAPDGIAIAAYVEIAR